MCKRIYKVAPPRGTAILATNDKGDAVCRVDMHPEPWPPPDCPECEVTCTESGMVGIVFTGSHGKIRAEGPSLAALDALAYKFCQTVAALRSQEK